MIKRAVFAHKVAVLPVAIQIVSVPVRRRGLDDAVIEGARVVAPLETVLRNGRALILSGEKQFPI